MGGDWFEAKSAGATVEEAYKKAVDEAIYEYGHRGYSGTIKEKSGFVLIPDSEWVGKWGDYRDYVTHLMRTHSPWIKDKWAEATAIHIGEGEWFFFGVASCLESNV